MPDINNQTKVTLTVIVTIIVAFFGYRFMSDLPLFRQSKIIYTHFDRVNGLSSGSYIYISGVRVGSVSKMQLIAPDSVRVSLNFNTGVDIKRGAVAYVESSGLLGDKAIYVEQGTSSETVPPGGTITGVYSGGMLESFQENGAQLTNDASESFDKLNSALTQLQQVVDEENRVKIDRMLSDLQQSSSELAMLMQRKRGDLESSIESLDRILSNVDTLTTENSSRIDSALAALNRSMHNFEQVSSELDKTNRKLNAILTKINQGEGSLGKLVNDSSLYNNMDSLSVELTRLIRNINENPARYLKGLKLIDVF